VDAHSPVGALAFGRVGDNPVLISGGDDCAVRAWDPVTGRELGLLADHAASITAVTTFEDGLGSPMACTGAEDGTHLIRLSSGLMQPLRLKWPD
jgi:WD40 repeat protein